MPENNHSDKDVNNEAVEQTKKAEDGRNYLIPAAIIIAGMFIAGAIVYTNNPQTPAEQNNDWIAEEEANNLAALENLAPLRETDHVRGNPDAPVKIFSYSDFECPFCKNFHATMRRVMDEQEESGEVAWVYRHFPIDSLHPMARMISEASECAHELGGDEAFWTFTDRFYEITPSNNRTDLETVLPQITAEAGLDWEEVEACVTSGRFAERVQQDTDNAAATGGRGTPWSIIVAPDGSKFPINGAQSYEVVQSLIEFAQNS